MSVLFTIIFLISLFPDIYANSMMPEFLCEIGIKFYQQGRLDEALHEFKKALLVQPNYEPALKYIRMIEQTRAPGKKKEEILLPSFKPPASTVTRAISEPSDLIELQREMMRGRGVAPATLPEVEAEAVSVSKKAAIAASAPALTSLPSILALDESAGQSIEIEQERSIIIRGQNIQRFLSTQPDILAVEKTSPDELLLTGKNIGYTYLHIWDDNGRVTLEFLVVPPRLKGPTYEEFLRISGTTPGTFKLRYSLDWSSYETGRNLATLERSSYVYSHSFNLNGETPYGNLDSAALIHSFKESTDLSYFTAGLMAGKFGPFQGFHLRAVDFDPGISNLAMGGASLRGVMLQSPAFDRKLDYTVFWGREGGGKYLSFSPSLGKVKNSFLSGMRIGYLPTKQQDYRFTMVHGWGRERSDYLNSYSYDLDTNWKVSDQVRLGYEVGNDSESSAHLIDLDYTIPKLNFTGQLREISKKYLSISGYGGQLGELGGVFSLNYVPWENLTITNNLNMFQDRLYPALDNDNRWNENYDWNVNYSIDPLTNLRLDYGIQNQLGRISQYRSQNAGVGLSKTFELLRKINTFAAYRHQENKYFTSPASDYINDKASLGLSLNLIGDLNYYLNREFNWLNERYMGSFNRPRVTETGVEWYGQVFNTPVNGNFRCGYHKEENAFSDFSFLSGEDYLENYLGFSYTTPTNKEFYGSSRFRNAWPQAPGANNRIEMNFNAGMRFIWDTGIRWDAVGDIEGYVFKDLNSDGLRQRDEPPLKGVKLWLGKDKYQETDLFGYYRFKGVRGNKAIVQLDVATLPEHFVLSVLFTQEANIVNHGAVRVDFGATTHSEISGLIFEDIDGNGVYSVGDIGIKDAVIKLENGKTAKTDATGRYYFYNVSTGEHTITLNLNSLPVYYMPKKALSKSIVLSEGTTYRHNIPLSRIKE